MAEIRVHTLGGLRIERDGQTLPDLPAQPVRVALLVYLALERSTTRDELATLLWPDRDTERARHSLSQTLYELRRDLGPDWVEPRGDALHAASTLTADALDAGELVEGGRHAEALATLRGPFLQGVHIGGTRPFEDWVQRWRSRTGRQLRIASREVARIREEAGDLDGALEVARDWVTADPLEDEAQHLLVHLLAATGRRSEALSRYEAYRELLARELEVEPLDETRELVDRIRAGDRWRQEPLRSEVVPADPGLPASPPPGFAAPYRWRGAPGVLVTLALVLVLVLGGLALRGLGSPDPGAAPAVVGSSAGAEAPARGGVVVLPFLNLSPDPDQEYFVDGITEDLIAHLSRIEGLRVISRTSAMRYKGTDLPAREVARELGVDHLLEGSVRRDGNRVRIVAQLIDGATDDHLWAETYERELTDIFLIQSQIAEQVAEALRQHLSPRERARIAAGGTDRVGAYELVLRGREYLNRPGEADVRKYPPAIAFFRQALEVDPGYARALAGLSQAYRENVGLPLTTRRDSAVAYGRRAVDADPDLAEAAGLLGFAFLFARDWNEVERHLDRALELDPNQGEALAGKGRLAWIHGRLDEAVLWQRRAVAVDPFSARQLGWLGSYLFDLGDLEGAEAAYRRARELAPDAPAASFNLAQIHLIRGEDAEAEEAIRQLLQSAGGHPGASFLTGRFYAQRGRLGEAAEHLARFAAALGDPAAARVHQAYVARALGDTAAAGRLLDDAWDELEELEGDGFFGPRLRLSIQALRGDREGALETLTRHWAHEISGDLLSGPQPGVYWIDTDPLLAELWDDPRFQALLVEMRTRLDSVRVLTDAGGRTP